MKRTAQLFAGAAPNPHPRLSVRLFGNLSVECDDQRGDRLGAAKAQELFSFLLLNRTRSHPRETLAALLWGDIPTDQSKKYLRHALWQLQSALRAHAAAAADALLLIGPDSVRLNPAARLWLDVAVVEHVFAVTHSLPPDNLDGAMVALLENAIELYRGPLLEGWYQDWCLHERERLQGIYLRMLDKLTSHCEATERFDEAVAYAALSLRCDRASERTHQQLMRIYAHAGDRAAALRQYDRCVAALQQELGVTPSDDTVDLYRRISAGQRAEPTARLSGCATTAAANASLSDVVTRLERLEAMLADIQRAVKHDIRIVRRTQASENHRERQSRLLATATQREHPHKRAADG